MINKIFAQNFIRKMKQTMELNVNVMDERGVIVASATKERIGDFHLCAYEIIQNNMPMMITREPTKELIGVNAPGINLRLSSSNETIGVIGVSGNPDEIMEIAKMVKLTFETMYEYEYKKNAAMKGNSGIWNFSHILLNETPLNEFSVHKAAVKLGLSEEYPRIPIYIPIHSEYRSTVIQHFIDLYTALPCFSHQDIALPTEKGILYMKACKAALKETPFKAYAEQVTACLKEDFLQREGDDGQGIDWQFLIGPVQNGFLHCHELYRELSWLSRQRCAPPSQAVFLTDHLTEFLAAQIPKETLDVLLSWYGSRIEEAFDRTFFLETAEHLLEADLKLDAAAQSLHLHKNSVIARLKKIKEVLDINPIASTRDAALLRCLVAYMKG